MLPALLQARATPPRLAHLVRGFVDRAGALFDRDVPEGTRRGAGRMADRYRGDRSVAGRPGKIQGRHLQPVRGPARAANSDCWSSISRKSASCGSSMRISAPWCSIASSTCLQDFGHLGTFDVIFCRNVLIYFDQDTKAGIFERLAKVVEPDGFMVLGAAKSVVGISDAFKPYPERRGLYRPNATRTAKPGVAVRHAAAREGRIASRSR